MAGSAEVFGQEAFQFIEELDSLDTADAVADAMKRVTARFGFEGLFIGGHKGHPSLSFNEIMLATKCPPELQATHLQVLHSLASAFCIPYVQLWRRGRPKGNPR